MKTIISRRGIMSMTAIVLSSFMFVTIAQTPTHALSLSDVTSGVSSGVTSLTQNIPVVKDLPIIGQQTKPTQTQPITSVPQTIVQTAQPSAQTNVTPTTSTPSSTASPAKIETNAPATAQPGTNQVALQFVPAEVGLSSIDNQAMIAAAVSQKPDNAIHYDSKKLNYGTANLLIFGGIAGMAIGGYALYALRPKNA